MTVTLLLPTVLRRLADDQKEVAVEADTVASAIQALADRHPALGQQLLDDKGLIRPFVRIFIGPDDAQSLDGPDTILPNGAVLRIVPAIAGG